MEFKIDKASGIAENASINANDESPVAAAKTRNAERVAVHVSPQQLPTPNIVLTFTDPPGPLSAEEASESNVEGNKNSESVKNDFVKARPMAAVCAVVDVGKWNVSNMQPKRRRAPRKQLSGKGASRPALKVNIEGRSPTPSLTNPDHTSQPHADGISGLTSSAHPNTQSPALGTRPALSRPKKPQVRPVIPRTQFSSQTQANTVPSSSIDPGQT